MLGVLDVTPVRSFAPGAAVGRVLHWGEGPAVSAWLFPVKEEEAAD